VALAPGPLRSPDGLETLGALQHGELDPGWSPPLWALVAGVPGLWGSPVRAAWVVNVLAAAAVVWPLGRVGAAAGGVVGGRAAVFCWVALAAATEHAAVIDARPLSWWVGASCAAASVSPMWRVNSTPPKSGSRLANSWRTSRSGQPASNRSVWPVSRQARCFQAMSWSKSPLAREKAVNRTGPISRSTLRRFLSISLSVEHPADRRSAS
jgi:hypothetical protein